MTELARPHAPPVLDSEAATLGNVFAARRALGTVAGLPLTGGGAVAAPADAIVIGLTIGGAPARLHAGRALLEALATGIDPAASGATTAGQALLAELALAPALAALEKRFPFMQVVAIDDAPLSPDDPPSAFALRLGEHAATLALSPDAARLLAAVLEHVSPVRTPVPGLRIPVAFRALATALPLATVRALVPGDVVLADARPGEDTALVVAGERLVWPARRAGATLTVTGPREDAWCRGWRDFLMSDPTDEPPDETVVPLDDLPVRLGFELGRAELTLAELEALGPGHVFPLNRREDDAVDIVSANRRIGRGRIVTVGGTLAVQVVHIGP